MKRKTSDLLTYFGRWISPVLLSSALVGCTNFEEPDDITEFAGSLRNDGHIAGGKLVVIGENKVIGKALLVQTRKDEVTVSVAVTGLTPNANYPAHLHNLPCEFGGGKHYLIDPAKPLPAGASVDPTNEIWPSFTTDVNGNGAGFATVTHEIRGDALSVVIHTPDLSKKLACADLQANMPTLVESKGKFRAFAAADAAAGDTKIGGRAELIRSGNSTSLEIDLRNLNSTATYMGHVHALPCEANTAGGHYFQNPTADPGDNNELWPRIVLSGTKLNRATDLRIWETHRARLDAQSVVIHRVVAPGNAPKVACANLQVDTRSLALSAQGSATVKFATNRFPNVQMSGLVLRRARATSYVRVAVSGVDPGAYTLHVHNLPCGVQNAGGHYKLNPSLSPTDPEEIRANELWLDVNATGVAGAASGTDTVRTSITPRADARSIVLHDPIGGAKQACVDLQPL